MHGKLGVGMDMAWPTFNPWTTQVQLNEQKFTRHGGSRIIHWLVHAIEIILDRRGKDRPHDFLLEATSTKSANVNLDLHIRNSPLWITKGEFDDKVIEEIRKIRKNEVSHWLMINWALTILKFKNKLIWFFKVHRLVV
jgi:hypothetical protein